MKWPWWWQQWWWWWWPFICRLTMGLLLCWELGCTVVFSYCDNPVKIFQDEKTEAYQELICPRLRMGNGSGQGMNPTGAPCELTMLTGEVFYNRGQARQNSHFCCFWLGLECLTGCAGSRSGVFHFLPCGSAVCMEHVGLAGRPVWALLNSAMAGIGKC